jgi:hypothetical protein
MQFLFNGYVLLATGEIRMETILNQENRTSVDSRNRELDYFTSQSSMSSPGKYSASFKNLPSGLKELVEVIQGLVIYDVVADDFYGFKIPKKRLNEIHLRTVEQMLETIFELDERPLTELRPLNKRLVGRCHHFMMLLLSVLRAQGVPARARCGFGAYFNPGYFEDHWVVEYWDMTKNSWLLVDTQLDEVWRKNLKIQFDTLNVPRTQFLVAGDAWGLCRQGKMDHTKFGIEFENLRGLWYIGGNLVRDLAALNKMEMLPWDVWGAQIQPPPEGKLGPHEIKYFDKLAPFSRSPSSSFPEVQRIYNNASGLKVPDVVFNAVLQQESRIDQFLL